MPFYGGNKTRKKAPAVKVYTRTAWAGPWILQPNLWCSSLEFTANSGRDEAVLVHEYGKGSAPDTVGRRRAVAPLGIGPIEDDPGDYVKIVVDPDGQADVNAIPPWYGRVIEAVDTYAGTAGDPKGRQTFICWGLEAELDLDPILTSIVERPDGNSDRIGRAIAFNAGAGHPQDMSEPASSNRGVALGMRGVYRFAKDFESGHIWWWSARDIIEYILAWHGPQDHDFEPVPEWRLDPTADLRHLETTHPKVATEGHTAKKILDQLMDRRRALGWTVRVDETVQPAVCYVVPFTHLDQRVRIQATGQEIPANAHQIVISADAAQDVEKCELRSIGGSRYDQVVVRGAAIGAVFSLSSLGERIVADWTNDDATAYQTAASGEGGYAGLNNEEKEFRNRHFRRNHSGKIGEHVRRVYSWFKLPDDWDGQVEDGEAANIGPGILQQNPDFARNEFERILWDKPAVFWRPGLRLLPHLPMFDDQDYTADRVHSDEINRTPADGEHLRPLFLFKVEEESGDPPSDRYEHADQLAAGSFSESTDEGGRTWAAHAQIHHNKCGFVLTVSGGAHHKIGKGDFLPCDATDQEPPDLDWQNNLIATVLMPLDQHLEIRLPTDNEIAAAGNLANKRIRRLVIEVPDGHLDYIVADTVVGVRDGILQRAWDNGVLRSDWRRLAAIAELAYNWYCRDRRALTLQLRQIYRVGDVGNLVVELAGRNTAVRTCITRVRYDFDGGRTTVQTQYNELDLKAM